MTPVESQRVAGGPAGIPVPLEVNGRRYVVELEPRVSLLDALRERLDLTGSKKGCDQGTCGACTVWIDGRRVLARMTDVARTPAVVQRYPAISRALLLSASEQLRNMASLGGNLRQRTRCAYLRDGVSPCNKREPGSGCAALDGLNRGHAILGTSEHCIATHPSDVAVALVAFDAVVETVGPAGERAIPVDDFFLLPGRTPELEHPISADELIVGIEVPAAPIARRSVYLKVRDRQSYEFALVSVAAALEVDDGTVTGARLALGGVGTRPWRARRAEAVLVGGPADAATFGRAAAAELADAVPRAHNGFKVELARRAIVRGLTQSMAGRQS
jgi:xanthine dehydrogenase YagS FAD-binding subunit